MRYPLMDKQDLKPGENKATYSSEGKKISALVYVPQDYKEGEKRPAIVMPDTASRYVYDHLRVYVQIRELTDGPQRKVVLVRLIKEPKMVQAVGLSR